MERTAREVYTEIRKHIDIFIADGQRWFLNKNKAAAVRSRKALDAISRLKKEYRKRTMDEGAKL